MRAVTCSGDLDNVQRGMREKRRTLWVCILAALAAVGPYVPWTFLVEAARFAQGADLVRLEALIVSRGR